jgi:hypothetical protein
MGLETDRIMSKHEGERGKGRRPQAHFVRLHLPQLRVFRELLTFLSNFILAFDESARVSTATHVMDNKALSNSETQIFHKM